VGSPHKRVLSRIGASLIAALLCPSAARAQIGDAFNGVGPINQSMGGAAVAAPIDSAGALFWNPASIAGLASSEIEAAVGLLDVRTWISSRVAAGALGGGLPAQSIYGHTGGNDGVTPVPILGLIYRPEDNPIWTYGFGLFPVAGFSVNYPATRNNPVLQPQPPYGMGLGPLSSSYELLQLAPTVACQLTDALALGFAGNLDLSSLSISPGVFGEPTVVSTPLGPAGNYGPATAGRYRWGAGFQVGAYYDPGGDWQFGASVKSPQWFDTYSYNSISFNGHATRPTFDLNFPLVASVGTAYTGIDRLLVALDLRFFDYRNTDGFNHVGFNRNGSVAGVGWQNVFSVAAGVQYQLTDALALRAGYTFALDGASDAVTSFNLFSPTIIQNTLACGLTYNVSNSFKVSLAYAHFFENSIEGPIVTPRGAIAHTAVQTSATADEVLFGVTVSF
jgi:long-chain fatty acid transport protein